MSFQQIVSIFPKPQINSSGECKSPYYLNGYIHCIKTGHHPSDGSALMCRGASDLWELHGIFTSYGTISKDISQPQIIASILEAREWIDVTVGRLVS